MNTTGRLLHYINDNQLPETLLEKYKQNSAFRAKGPCMFSVAFIQNIKFYLCMELEDTAISIFQHEC